MTKEQQAGTTATDDDLTTDKDQAVKDKDSATDSDVKDKGVDTSTRDHQFYDLASLPEELLPIGKKMQAAFTKKMQKLSDQSKKIEVYDQFQVDPHGTLRRLATAYGLEVKEPGSRTAKGEGEDETVEAWLDKKLSAALEPYKEKIGKIEESTFRTYLDTFYPDWYEYEDEMVALLRKHPSLRNDLDNLYQLATLDKVEARVTRDTIADIKKKKDDVIDIKKKSTDDADLEPSVERRMSLKEAMQMAKKKTMT